MAGGRQADLNAMMGNPAFQEMIAQRLNDIQGMDSGLAKQHFEGLPEAVKQRVEVLREIQEEHDGLEEEYEKEARALEEKYRNLMTPLYERRQRIVDGAEEVQGADGDVRGVPEFWYVCLRNHPEVASMMGEKDHDVLKYLRSVKDEKLEGTPGFKLVFEFAPNEHFTNTVLEKTYEMAEEDEDMLAQCTGTKIEWAAGKDITMKLMKKKGKKGKTQFKTEKADSFFNFFNPPRIPDMADAPDEDEMEELQMELEQHYDVGTTIRDEVIPNAVKWFTGEALEDMEDDDDDDDEEGEEGREARDPEDEDEDDDDEEDDGAKGNAGQEKPAECKQQ